MRAASSGQEVRHPAAQTEAGRTDAAAEMATAASRAGSTDRSRLRGMLHADLIGLQRIAGSSAVAQVLRRLATWPATGSEAYNPFREDYEKARRERDAFVAAGKKGPQPYNPSSRNPDNYYGGFDVEYDPAAGQLTVTLKGAVLFLAGMTLSANGRAVAVEPSPQTAAAAAAINRLPKAARPAEVAKWTWASQGGPDAGDDARFLTLFASSISSAWTEKHSFACTRRYWQDLGAKTDVRVEVNRIEAATDKAVTQHMLVNAHKVVEGFVGGEADVSRPEGAAGPFDNIMNVTSEDVLPRTDKLLERELRFQRGKGRLTAGSVQTVWRLAQEMPNAPPGATVPVAGITVRVQGKDEQQRSDRIAAITYHLHRAAGFDTARATFVHDGEGDAGHITIGSGAAQTVVAHEAGHMFGLDDEYTGAGDYAAGKKTEHTDFAAAAGHRGAMHARSDSIMSEGKEVRPHHYVTFLDALKQVTGIEEWGYGVPRAVKLPSGLGDYPIPSEADGTALV